MSEQKIEQFWRDANADDVARVMAGGTVEARFRDPPGGWGDWVLRAVDNSTLFIAGWKDGEWFDHEGDNWTQCQVYDPPQWFLDKPDPGEGFRLLEKFLDEDVLLGDSVFCTESKIWIDLKAGFDPGQLSTYWYRRRIEPVEAVEMVAYQAEIGEVIEFPCGIKLAGTAKGFEVTQ